MSEDRCHVLEGEAGEQPGQESIPFLCQSELLVEIDGSLVREEMTGLDLDQSGGDEQELAGDLDVEILHHLEIRQVLRHQVSKAQLGDLDLM